VEIFDTLATYGNKGMMDALSDLMNEVVNPHLKSHDVQILKDQKYV
jgi:hypothetical protein